MSSVPQFTVTSRDERREARGNNHRFEDQAASILETHVTRLDVHRRSVLLFYLLFGLLAGFFLGLAGAKGVLAKTVDTELLDATAQTQLTLSETAAPSELPMDWDVDAAFGPRHDFRVTASEHRSAKTARYAMLPLGGAHPVFAQAVDGLDQLTAQTSRELQHKGLYMGLLAVIMLVTGSLTFAFWRHLSQAYTPRRKASLKWAPGKSHKP
jgi:hypothetical protein